MSKVKPEILNEVQRTWKKAPEGCNVFECFKCSGSGLFYFQDGSTGVCFACKGAKLLPNLFARSANLRDKTRHITQVEFNEEDKTVEICYLAHEKNTGELQAWHKKYFLDKANSEQLEKLRAIYFIGTQRDKQTACSSSANQRTQL